MTQIRQLSSAFSDLSKGAQMILVAAKELFAEKGFNAVSINEIAARADISKANVFHHFRSKDDLYLAVLKAACEETVGSLAEAHSNGGTAEELWTFFSSQLSALLKNRDSARLILREIMESSKERGQALAEQVFAGYFSRLVNMVCEAQTQGLLRKDFDPALLAYLLLGANIFFFENHAVTAHLVEGEFARIPDRYSHDVFRLLLKGALADPETDFQFMEA